VRRYRNGRVQIAVVVLSFIIALSLFAPWLATHDPRQAKPEDQLQAPSASYWLGTDLLGRDVYSRILYGGRRTIGMALFTLVVTIVPGMVLGVVAGYGGRRIDMVVMVAMDALLAFPGLIMALALIALFGQGVVQVALAVGIAGIPGYARVTRAVVLEARTRPFVEAAQALGARSTTIIWWHILPTVSPPLLAFAGVTLSWALLNGAALTFLGYGGDLAAPDWGVMLADGRSAFRLAPWAVIAPGMALSVTVFAINLLANGLAETPEAR